VRDLRPHGRAARTSDWQRLIALEQDVAHLRDTLAAAPRSRMPPLTAAERARKIELIHRILAGDAEVRSYTEPWMASIGRFVGAATPRRPLQGGPARA
jgi:flagellar protein FliT